MNKCKTFCTIYENLDGYEQDLQMYQIFLQKSSEKGELFFEKMRLYR